MSQNDVPEKKEPVIISHWIPITVMIPAKVKQPEEEQPKRSSAKKLIPAIILIAIAWYITHGWRLFQ